MALEIRLGKDLKAHPVQARGQGHLHCTVCMVTAQSQRCLLALFVMILQPKMNFFIITPPHLPVKTILEDPQGSVTLPLSIPEKSQLAPEAGPARLLLPPRLSVCPLIAPGHFCPL